MGARVMGTGRVYTGGYTGGYTVSVSVSGSVSVSVSGSVSVSVLGAVCLSARCSVSQCQYPFTRLLSVLTLWPNNLFISFLNGQNENISCFSVFIDVSEKGHF